MRNSLIILLLLLLCACNQTGVTEQMRKDLDSIAKKWVPDDREGICIYTLEVLKNKTLLLSGETDIENAKEEIVNYIYQAGFNLTDSLNLLPDELEVVKPWGLVTVSVCNIKSEPSYSSELVSQAVMGTPVKLLKAAGSWLMIQTPDYYLGWVTGGSIVKLSDEEFISWKESDRLIFTGKSDDILSDDNASVVVSDITTGSILRCISEARDYYFVVLPDGRRGKIKRNMAVDFGKWCEDIKPDPAKMIEFAKSFLGYPYLWGGTSSKAFDCSGFVKTVYFTGGIILARDASLQYLHGKYVDISSSFDNLIPGDLLFFGYLNDRGEERIIHVGMYIGDAEVIHSSGMVNISSIDPERDNYSTYLGETLKGAMRVIGEEPEKGMELIKNHSWYNNQ